MSKTNFDRHLEKYLQDPAFAEKFKQADEAWDVALQLADLRQQAGLSQAQLARKLKTSQQQISRLESPNYGGHSLSMLRRVAEALDARVKVTLEPAPDRRAVSEDKAPYPPAKRQAKAKTSKTATSKARAGKKAVKKGKSRAGPAEVQRS